MAHFAASKKVINNSARTAEQESALRFTNKSLKICKFVGLIEHKICCLLYIAQNRVY